MLRLAARWVLPVSAPPLAHGAVLVEAGRIVAVGPAADVSVPANGRSIDLGDAALLPGLVNTHAHPELTGLRGLLEDLSFPDWIATLMRTRAAPDVSDLAARWGSIEAIAAGITTVGATETSGAAADALTEAGLRGVVFVEVFGPDERQAPESMRSLRATVETLRARAGDRVAVGVSPHAPFSVSDALFREAAAYARSESLPLAVHTAESVAEEDWVVRGEGVFAERLGARGIAPPPPARSTIERLARTGVLDTGPLLIHCVRIDAQDIASIARAGATIAHCPIANARLGHGIAPVPALLEAGVTVGLGTDSVASNNRLDLLEEARVAQLLQRATHADPALLPADRLLRMATLDGARALRIDRVGAIEPGFEADLCAVSLAGPHVRPVHDPVAAVVHAARASDVLLTMVAGRILHGVDTDVRDGTESLRDALDDAARALREAAGR